MHIVGAPCQYFQGSRGIFPLHENTLGVKRLWALNRTMGYGFGYDYTKSKTRRVAVGTNELPEDTHICYWRTCFGATELAGQEVG